LVFSLAHGIVTKGQPHVPLLLVSVLVEFWSILMMIGFFTLQPREARVLVLFGEYRGTVKRSGFHWGNPFYANGITITQNLHSHGASEPKHGGSGARTIKRHSRNKISLRTRNFNGERLKVNDKRGNPIEIAAVVVWRVVETFEAVFNVDDYEHFMHVQSESAVRNLATSYPYDAHDDGHVCLRLSAGEVADRLRHEIQDRLTRAGIEVIEARLSHLAYAPEIAGAMLRRQQASAVVAARQKIVEGAVGMVEMALDELDRKRVVELDQERKAAMVSNLLVVLCSERGVEPVVNTGTLYQ
jgi:regulator of protease activity HflC (stomatin/prohibitin superfamily)